MLHQQCLLPEYLHVFLKLIHEDMQVAKRFLAAVKESTDLQMAFFINYNAQDILRQAEQSALRYKRGIDALTFNKL